MSKTFSYLISTTAVIILFFVIENTAYAACMLGMFCPDPGKIPYCETGTNCTISGGLLATETAVNGLFTKKTISEFVVDTILYFLSFVTLVGVIYVIYAGLQLMTGGGDEEKVKKARKIIIYVLAGIILIWISYWLVVILIDVL